MAELGNCAPKQKVAIVGCGLIGSSWATLFASSGYSVGVYDVNLSMIALAKSQIRNNLECLQKHGLLRGPGTAQEQYENVSFTTQLEQCLEDAIYCQESVAENIEVKKRVFAEIDAVVGDRTIIASSTSAIPPSSFVQNLKHRSQCLVAHPVNPPLYLKLVEIVPSPWTLPEVLETARIIMKSIGQMPIVVKKEVPGFALNRIQYAIIEEAWRLVKNGVLSPEDIDTVMKEGLGPRYAFFGPFEVMHLNANGISDYMDRYMDGVSKVIDSFGKKPSFDEDSVKQSLTVSLNNKMPVEELADFIKKREAFLVELCKLKQN